MTSWDKSLELGHPLIDNQHKNLIYLIDEFKAAAGKPQKQQLALLDKVMEFTQTHFLAEEQLMREVNYPPELINEMIEQHREFKAYARLRVLEFRLANETESVNSLHAFLIHWVILHEFGFDRTLVNWIKQQR